jgi:hypothetical protein
MLKNGRTALVILTLLLVIACMLPGQRAEGDKPSQPDKPFLDKDPTPLPLLSDLFFSGCTYHDVNNNQELDEKDAPMGGIMVFVELSNGGQFGGHTAEGSGCVFLTVPGGTSSDYPAILTATVPEGVPLELLQPSSIVLDSPESHADFLFVVIPEDV